MEHAFDLLHKNMLDDITGCVKLDHPEKENAESCYWIARNYWGQNRDVVNRRGFKNDEEEIQFFKVVKPKFASYIEYFSLLSEGLQFAPPLIPFPTDLEIKKCEWERIYRQTVTDYWTNEESRGERHYGKYIEFLDYCEADQKDKDHMYFLRRNVSFQEVSQRRSHNRDTELFTPHEEILTAWEGFKLYKEYIRKKLKEVMEVEERVDKKSEN